MKTTEQKDMSMKLSQMSAEERLRMVGFAVERLESLLERAIRAKFGIEK